MKISHVGDLAPPITQAIPGTDTRQLIIEWFSYFMIGTKHIKVRIPSNFIFDGASIPRVFWSVVGSPFEDNHELAGLVHDWLYHKHICTRKEADHVFLYILKQHGAARWKARVMFRAVRMFGGNFWN